MEVYKFRGFPKSSRSFSELWIPFSSRSLGVDRREVMESFCTAASKKAKHHPKSHPMFNPGQQIGKIPISGNSVMTFHPHQKVKQPSRGAFFFRSYGEDTVRMKYAWREHLSYEKGRWKISFSRQRIFPILSILLLKMRIICETTTQIFHWT